MGRPRKTQGAGSLLEAAVNRVGLALNNLQAVFETEGHSLTAEQHQKVFAFVNVTVAGIEQKTRLSLSTNVLTSGLFSLDLDAPVRPATPHEAARTLHMPAEAIQGLATRAPVQTIDNPLPKLSAQQLLELRKQQLADKAPDPLSKATSGDDIGFIDE